jgi:hypothetical protein
MGRRKFLLTCFVVVGWLPIPVSALEALYTPEEKFAMSQAAFCGVREVRNDSRRS